MAIALLPPQASAAPRTSLPPAFEGSWASDYAQCHSLEWPGANWTIKGSSLWTFEGGADVTRAKPLDDTGRSFALDLTMSGGGEEWPARVEATIAGDGGFLTIEDLSGDSGLPGQLWRCADPVPDLFLGEWAANPAIDCGKPYASVRVTRGGFVMPEVGERIVMLETVPENPREATMEADVSIAGTSYRERRILRLSEDLQTLELVSLGQIETGSEDPDWRPDPSARFRDPSSPARIKLLSRCSERAD